MCKSGQMHFLILFDYLTDEFHFFIICGVGMTLVIYTCTKQKHFLYKIQFFQQPRPLSYLEDKLLTRQAPFFRISLKNVTNYSIVYYIIYMQHVQSVALTATSL